MTRCERRNIFERGSVTTHVLVKKVYASSEPKHIRIGHLQAIGGLGVDRRESGGAGFTVGDVILGAVMNGLYTKSQGSLRES
jgi:hypothetical protein